LKVLVYLNIFRFNMVKRVYEGLLTSTGQGFETSRRSG
jgi:hypothetical protein